MATLERIYTIPLGDAYLRVRNTRAKRAIAFVRNFAQRHMKALGVYISEGTNSLVFRDGMQKPPRRIKVRIVREDSGIAKVWLIGEEEKVKAEAEKKKAAEKKADAKPVPKTEAKPPAGKTEPKPGSEAPKTEAKSPAAAPKPDNKQEVKKEESKAPSTVKPKEEAKGNLQNKPATPPVTKK